MNATTPALQPWVSPATATSQITNGQTGTVSFDVKADVDAILAAIVNTIFGVLVAWVLVRYRFPGRRWLDAAVDGRQIRARLGDAPTTP